MRWEADGGCCVSIEEFSMLYRFGIKLNPACLLNSDPGYADWCLTEYSDLKHSFLGLLQLLPAVFNWPHVVKHEAGKEGRFGRPHLVLSTSAGIVIAKDADMEGIPVGLTVAKQDVDSTRENCERLSGLNGALRFFRLGDEAAHMNPC